MQLICCDNDFYVMKHSPSDLCRNIPKRKQLQNKDINLPRSYAENSLLASMFTGWKRKRNPNNTWQHATGLCAEGGEGHPIPCALYDISIRVGHLQYGINFFMADKPAGG